MKLVEKLRNLTVAELVTLGVSGVAIVAALGSGGRMIAGSSSFAAKEFALKAQVTQLKSDLAAYQEDDAEAEEETETADTEKKKPATAQSMGTKVAEYQTQYVKEVLDHDYSDSKQLRRESIAKTLAPFFAEGETAGYQSWFDPSYQYQTGVAPLFVWSFECPYQFEGESLPVLWICRQARNSNSVVGWATGTYDAGSKQFDGIETYLSNVGAAASVQAYQETKSEPEDGGASSVSGNDVSGNSVSGDAEEMDGAALFEDDSESDASESDESDAVSGNDTPVSDEPETGADPSSDDMGIPDDFFVRDSGNNEGGASV